MIKPDDVDSMRDAYYELSEFARRCADKADLDAAQLAIVLASLAGYLADLGELDRTELIDVVLEAPGPAGVQQYIVTRYGPGEGGEVN
jgi:hypothetical protein